VHFEHGRAPTLIVAKSIPQIIFLNIVRFFLVAILRDIFLGGNKNKWEKRKKDIECFVGLGRGV